MNDTIVGVAIPINVKLNFVPAAPRYAVCYQLTYPLVPRRIVLWSCYFNRLNSTLIKTHTLSDSCQTHILSEF